MGNDQSTQPRVEYRLADFFSDIEIIEAWELVQCCTPATATDRLVNEFVLPRLDKINDITGQMNDPRYIAYVLQYVFRLARHHAR